MSTFPRPRTAPSDENVEIRIDAAQSPTLADLPTTATDRGPHENLQPDSAMGKRMWRAGRPDQANHERRQQKLCKLLGDTRWAGEGGIGETRKGNCAALSPDRESDPPDVSTKIAVT